MTIITRWDDRTKEINIKGTTEKEYNFIKEVLLELQDDISKKDTIVQFDIKELEEE